MHDMAIHIWAKLWVHISCSLSNTLLAHIQAALPSAGPLWCGAPVQLHSLRCFWREAGLSCNQNSPISLTSYQCDHMYTHCASKIWIWNLKLRGFTIPTGLPCMHLWQQSPTTHTSLPKFVPVCPFSHLCLLPTKFKAMRCIAPSLISLLVGEWAGHRQLWEAPQRQPWPKSQFIPSWVEFQQILKTETWILGMYMCRE